MHDQHIPSDYIEDCVKDQNIDYESDGEYDEIKTGITSWGISTTVHALILFIVSSFYIYQNIEIERPPVSLTPIDPPPIIENEDPIKEIEIEEIEITIENEIVEEEIKVTELEQVEEIEETEDDVVEEADIKGREDAFTDIEQGSVSKFMNPIGVGGPGSGAFGRAIGGDKRKLSKGYGPNARRASSSIDRALKWLVRHQSRSGMWDADDYWENCLDTIKCEPGQDKGGADEAITGYAVLCFLGAGYDHKTPNKYRKVVNKGIDWILNKQSEKGLIGKRNYEHSVGTMALCEAYAMTNDPKLKEPCQKAVDIILDRQLKKDGYPLGWDYITPSPTRVDISVSGWAVMALKAAAAGGFDVGDGLTGAKTFIKEAWKSANINWETIDPYGKTIFPYSWNTINSETNKKHLSFVGTLCSVFLGEQGIMLDTMMNDVDSRWFDSSAYKKNSYALYYASLSSFQVGGKHWKDKWGHSKNGYVPWLIDTMITNGNCEDGTWKHEKEKWHGSDTSPVLLHVYKLLGLEVAIRYEIVNA